MLVKPHGKAIILSDIHYPYHDNNTLLAIEKYMAQEKFDYYINLGDLIDFDYISKYNEYNKRGNENKRIKEDYEAVGKMLDRHLKLVKNNNPKAQFFLLEGNHELRMEKFIDKEPIAEGFLEVESGLNLSQRGIKYIRYDDILQIGKAYFIHGKYCNKYHAFKHVDNYGVNIFYGHTHDVQCYSKVTHGSNSTMVGQSVGCLCEYQQRYLKGNPTNWQLAFCTIDFMENGRFSYYITRIFDSSFIAPNGKYYSYK